MKRSKSYGYFGKIFKFKFLAVWTCNTAVNEDNMKLIMKQEGRGQGTTFKRMT